MNKESICKLQKEIRFETNRYLENHKKISELRIKNIEITNNISIKEKELLEAYNE